MKTYIKHRNLSWSVFVVLFLLFTNNLGLAQNVGIGVANPTARLHILPGSTAAGTAPIKLINGNLLTTPEPGTIEYKGHTFYATTYLVRRSIMLAQDVVVAPVKVANTTTETAIYTSTMAANYFTPGKMINIKLYGRFSTNNTNAIYTIRVNMGGKNLLTINSTSQLATNRPFEIDLRSTVRTIGSNGSIISFGKTQQDNMASNIEISDLVSVNTTAANTITISVQWNTPHTNNTFTLEGGATECIDQNN